MVKGAGEGVVDRNLFHLGTHLLLTCMFSVVGIRAWADAEGML